MKVSCKTKKQELSFNNGSLCITVEKAAMAALDDSDDEYEELEDDFLMIANEGQVAIEEVEEDADEAE